MTVLRDISFLWSMFHIIVFFLLLFEPRFPWPVTLTAGFAGAGVLLVVNVMTMFWQGSGIIMRAAFFLALQIPGWPFFLSVLPVRHFMLLDSADHKFS